MHSFVWFNNAPFIISIYLQSLHRYLYSHLLHGSILLQFSVVYFFKLSDATASIRVPFSDKGYSLSPGQVVITPSAVMEIVDFKQGLNFVLMEKSVNVIASVLSQKPLTENQNKKVIYGGL